MVLKNKYRFWGSRTIDKTFAVKGILVIPTSFYDMYQKMKNKQTNLKISVIPISLFHDV